MRLPRMSGNAWVCTVITLILLASGTEQAIRAMKQKAEQPPTQPTARLVEGDLAPEFTLPDEDGKQYSLAQFRGKPLVVTFYCGCSRCEEIAKGLAAWQKKKNTNIVGLVTFKPEFMTEFRVKTGVKHPLLLDPNKEVGAKWDSMICPRVWVLDRSGRAVFTNPHEPDIMPAEATVAMVVRAFSKSVPTAEPKTASANSARS